MPESRKTLNPLTLTLGASLFIVLVLVLAGGRESPTVVTQERLQDLKDAVTAFYAENGRAPSALDELGLPEDLLKDHLGEPIRYESIDGAVILTSYGSDKKPGGLFFKRDHVVAFNLP